ADALSLSIPVPDSSRSGTTRARTTGPTWTPIHSSGLFPKDDPRALSASFRDLPLRGCGWRSSRDTRATDMGYRIEVRDKDLNRLGEIDTWLQLDMVIQFCDRGSWKLLVKNGTPQAQLLERGGGVAIYQDGVEKPILTGQIEDFQTYWTTVQHSSEGSVFVGGKTDNKLAFSRLAF